MVLDAGAAGRSYAEGEAIIRQGASGGTGDEDEAICAAGVVKAGFTHS